MSSLHIVDPEVSAYIDETLAPSPEPLPQLEARARSEGFPIIGPQVGRIVSLLTATAGARRILELGSGFGYSALWFAHGMGVFGTGDGGGPQPAVTGDRTGDGGDLEPESPPAADRGRRLAAPEIHCTDADHLNAESATQYFEHAGISHLVHFHVGNALSYGDLLIKQRAAPFDIVFNDIDKEDYPNVPELAAELLGPGGLLITDNTLWYGLVANTRAADDVTAGIQEYNRIVSRGGAWESVIIPVRDGVTISRKI